MVGPYPFRTGPFGRGPGAVRPGFARGPLGSTHPAGRERAGLGAAYSVAMPTLPLFPLGAVLAPSERLPLRVFERRYVVLLRDLLRVRREAGLAEFGVIGIRAGHEVGDGNAVALHDVGSAARLVEVSERNDGSYDVVAEGTRRFRLDALVEGRRTPYLAAYVTWLPERIRDTELVMALTKRLRAAVTAYRAELRLADVMLPDDPVELSHQAMRHVMMERADRQRLLEAKDVDTRLRMALALTRREATLQRELSAYPGGYTPAQPVAN